MFLTSLENGEKPKKKPPSLSALLHPTTFPNIATLAVVAQRPVVWEIQDNFQKQTYRNRYHICTDQGLHKLSIPIKHVGGTDGRQKYTEVLIDNSDRWQLIHWRTVQTAYRTSPFFEFYEDDLAPLFEEKYAKLIDFNWASIQFLGQALDLDIPKDYSESYQKESTDSLDRRHLVNAKKASTFTFDPYTQVFGERHGFLPNVSTLDLLFNEGPNAANYLKQVTLI